MTEKHIVLVVNHDQVMRDLICTFVDELSHEHASASTVENAISETEARRISCVILDLSLAKGDSVYLIATLLHSNPCCSFIALSPETHLETTEAFHEDISEYLLAPVHFSQFKASLNRALHRYTTVDDRNRLSEELRRERELVAVRVGEVNRLRENICRLELDNQRKQTLLRLKSMLMGSYTEESLFGHLFEELASILPLQCIVLATESAQDFCIVTVPDEHDGSKVIVIESSANATPFTRTSSADNSWEKVIRTAAENHAGAVLDAWRVHIYPQHEMAQQRCAVALFLPDDYELESDWDEFLSECAQTVAAELTELRFLAYSAKQAIVGNLALDQSRIMLQELTAIRTNAGLLMLSETSSDASESLRIIDDSAEKLGQRLLELREISLPDKNATQTVHLADLIAEVLVLLDDTLRERRIQIDLALLTRGSCILFNGSALTHTFLDLISSVVRAQGAGNTFVLNLRENESDIVTFDIVFTDVDAVSLRAGLLNAQPGLQNHPKFVMAQRTVQTCGGRLSTMRDLNDHYVIRTVWPKNVLDSSPQLESSAVL